MRRFDYTFLRDLSVDTDLPDAVAIVERLKERGAHRIRISPKVYAGTERRPRYIRSGDRSVLHPDLQHRQLLEEQLEFPLLLDGVSVQ